MSETTRTPEPWEHYAISGQHHIVEAGTVRHEGETTAAVWIAEVQSGEDSDEGDAISALNAARIVACVNALAGLPQEALDGGWTYAGQNAYAKGLEAAAEGLRGLVQRALKERKAIADALRDYDDAFADFDPDNATSRARMRGVVIVARAALARVGP